MRITVSFALAAASALLTGCALPGSATGRLALSGTLLDEAGAPLPDEAVECLLPAEYGLGGLDRYFGEPADYGHHDRRHTVTTDAQGAFRVEFGEVVYHTTFWLLPPLGTFPGRPPAPQVGLRLTRRPDECYGVDTRRNAFRVFRPDGEEVPVEASHLAGVTADVDESASDATGARATVGRVTLKLRDTR